MFATLRSRPPPPSAAISTRRLLLTSIPSPRRIFSLPKTSPLFFHRNYQPPPPTQHKPPPRDPRNPYGYIPYNNEHYIRLQAAEPLPTPSTISITTVIFFSSISALIFYFSNLETVPVSGRTRFNVYSRDRTIEISQMQYKRIIASLHDQGGRILPDWDYRTQLVKRVMRRLIPKSGLTDQEWEILVIEDDSQANAFVLPGGKVFVFSGLLRVARNESGIAAVLGHEIAHDLAEHVGERLSADIGTNILMYALFVMGGTVGLGPLLWWFVGKRFMDVAFGYPMSRKQESEADYIGLMMMSEACYDPGEAVRFWQRMERVGQGNGVVPEWGSTHPSNESRIRSIEGWLGEARERRERSDCGAGVGGFAEAFREALRRGQVVVVNG
ncbi:peptidase family M48-domain-containing protein [Podospora fimiseda]|uniref:Peptidase family M48-domain-containing protein n=1 Tax=Podospora fimiseda TaxID=252190 RepID=A0AAN7GSG2_9PEZI|nr:peptidase family M48-domain-containing protein [Podospora fimiseda]